LPDVAGEVYALDRGLPFGERINALAGFRGQRWLVTRWWTNSVAPRLSDLAVRSWRARPERILRSKTPFLLCLSREPVRDGLKLLVSEWMEFRRAVPAATLHLVLRVAPPGRKQTLFDFLAAYWEQVQALKRQLSVPRAGIYLWVRDADDPGDEQVLERAHGLVVVARGQGFTDPLTLALNQAKPVIAPRCELLPPENQFTFATRPAVLRFLGEPRRRDTSSEPWPIPEEMELAKAIERFAEATLQSKQTKSVTGTLGGICGPGDFTRDRVKHQQGRRRSATS
jgi:hypothetical protein